MGILDLLLDAKRPGAPETIPPPVKSPLERLLYIEPTSALTPSQIKAGGNTLADFLFPVTSEALAVPETRPVAPDYVGKVPSNQPSWSGAAMAAPFEVAAALPAGLGKAALAAAPLAARWAAKEAPAVEKTAIKGIRAYHGSPHDFERFDISKIGTGEGAQAYGHGLYFAEKEGVAANYRNNLAPVDWSRTGSGKPLSSDLARILEDTSKEYGTTTIGDVMAVAREKLERQAKDAAKAGDFDWYAKVADQQSELTHLFRDRPATQGRMYEVNIKAEPEQFLDWDKPLSQQGASVQKALEKYSYKSDPQGEKEFTDALLSALEGTGPAQLPKMPANPPGSVIYQNLPIPDRSKERVASVLHDAGIPGIKYLDQGSRAAGDGSRNYVVFDPNIIEIVRKYGWAGLAMLGYGSLPSSEAEAAQ